MNNSRGAVHTTIGQRELGMPSGIIYLQCKSQNRDLTEVLGGSLDELDI
jgi:hypothetical protein